MVVLVLVIPCLLIVLARNSTGGKGVASYGGSGGGSGGSGSRTTCSSKGVVGWHWLRGSSDDNNGVSGGGVRGGGL